MRRILYTVVIALFASVAIGAVDAKIDGPVESKAGSMFVLDAGNSTGDSHQWIVPSVVGNNYIACGDRIGTSIAEPGEYRFIVVVADKEASIDWAEHTIIILGAIPVPIPDPNPDQPGPVDPVPPPVADFGPLEALSERVAIAVADSVTAVRLAGEFQSLLVSIAAMPTVGDARAVVSLAFEKVMLQREGESRNANWLETWRRPINDELAKLSTAGAIVTASQYAQAIDSVARGLVASADSIGRPIPPGSQPTPTPTPVIGKKWIDVYSSASCSWCDKLKKETLPTFQAEGFELRPQPDGHGKPNVPVVVFHFEDGTTSTEIVGFRTVDQMRKAIMQ